MAKHSPELASAVAAYTDEPGRVDVVSVEPANSSRVILRLPKQGAEKLLAGFARKDPVLSAFLEDFGLLDARPLTANEPAAKPIRPQAVEYSSDLTFITNEQGGAYATVSLLCLATTRASSIVSSATSSSAGFTNFIPRSRRPRRFGFSSASRPTGATYELIQTAKEQQEFVLESHAQVRERVPGEILDEFQKVRRQFGD